MKIHSDNPESEVRIELLPLIDVIFCILTFFILAAVTLTRQTAINLDLPKASTGVAQTRELMIVSISPSGQLYIDKQPTSRDELYQALLIYVNQNPQGMVVLNAPRLASYENVIEVLDLLKSVGGDRVALATLPDFAPGAPLETQPQNGIPSQQPSPLPGVESNPVNPYDPLGSPGTTNPFTPNQPLFPAAPTPAAPGNGLGNPAPGTSP